MAYSILNRAKAKKWWGKGVAGHADHSLGAVCLKPYQYSCWNKNDPNATLLSTLRAEYRKAIQDPNCRASLKALIDALDGFASDPTLGSTHYLTWRLHETAPPAWALDKEFIQIGEHRFFSGIA